MPKDNEEIEVILNDPREDKEHGLFATVTVSKEKPKPNK
jgi:hypothetical protein